MKIGIFDSGLGGLIVARAIHKLMPEYDYVYLGDTKRVPYGNRSEKTVYEFTKQGVDYLFNKENCVIVIIACNTASARALRRIQQESKRKVLGVLIPAAEEASKYERVGVLATTGTVASGTFPKEIKKISRSTKVFQNSAPMLVPMIEAGENALAGPLLLKYLQPLLKLKIDALTLGCTHYPILKKEIKNLISKNIKIISQDEVVPPKLQDYFKKHPEVENKISKNGKVKILVTDNTKVVENLTQKWFGGVKPKLVHL